MLTLSFEQYEGGDEPTALQLARPMLQELQSSSPATLSSCFNCAVYFKLPAYGNTEDTAKAGETVRSLPKGSYGFSMCMCRGLLGKDEKREYGISREEVQASWQAEKAARSWMESVRQKADRERGPTHRSQADASHYDDPHVHQREVDHYNH